MPLEQNLTELDPGALARVTRFSESAKLTSRLGEMGVIPGVVLRLIKTAPFNGPIEVKVRDYYISIRYDDAKNIFVEDRDDRSK